MSSICYQVSDIGTENSEVLELFFYTGDKLVITVNTNRRSWRI
nr:MAG TPA: hypothetical protein [Caudoviricetes sp.]